MQLNGNKDFLEVFSKALKKEINIDDKDLYEAVDNMLAKSNIKNFNEYIRTFQYRKRIPNIEDIADEYKYLKYSYKHRGDLLGHSGQVERIAFDNTGKHVLSGGSDGMIKIWDVETGFLMHTCIGHRNLVNDLCFSKDGKLVVSCDFNGIINIWDLEILKVRFTIKLLTGVTFSEFFEIKDQKNVYNLVVILCNGLVKSYKFDLDGILEEKENDFTIDEPYKAICITDGGRFLLRAGYWPYLILLDTISLEKSVIFETNNLPVQTICAAKDSLKFAAGCGNWLFQWTYFYEGTSSMGNFNRNSRILPGHWKKNFFKLELEDNFIIDNMCYLKNGYLVCVCTDLKIRIYSERILRYTIQADEMGVLCSHPSDNVFAYYGQYLKFYYMDKLISCEKINFNINDCQFSNDGENFVIGDELGNVRSFAINCEKFMFKEQFFLSDFEHFTGATDVLYRDCKNDCTLDANRNRNERWELIPYYSQPINNIKNVLIEEASLLHFTSKYLDKLKYKRKYCEFNVDPSVNIFEIEESDDSSDISDESSSETLSPPENENKSSDEELIIRRRGNFREVHPSPENKIPVTLRRNFVEPEDIPKPRGIRLRRNDNNEDEGLEFFHYQRKPVKRRKKAKDTEVPLVQRLRRNVNYEDPEVSLVQRLRRNVNHEDPEVPLVQRLRRNVNYEEVNNTSNIEVSSTSPKIRLRRHRPSDD